MSVLKDKIYRTHNVAIANLHFRAHKLHDKDSRFRPLTSSYRLTGKSAKAQRSAQLTHLFLQPALQLSRRNIPILDGAGTRTRALSNGFL